MGKMKLTQKNFDKFVEALNHRMTKVETNTKWTKWLLGYLATLFTIMVGAGATLIFKLLT